MSTYRMIPSLHQSIDFERLAARIKELFPFADVTSFALVHGGFMSQNFRFETEQGPFFLKQYRNRLNHVIYEIKTAEEFFATQGLPVIAPVKDKHGRSGFWFDGHWLSVFPFMLGASPRFGEVTPDIAHSIGRTLGRFHRVGRRFPETHFQHLRLWDKRKFDMEKIELIDLLSRKPVLTPLDALMLDILKMKTELIEKNPLQPLDIPLPFNCLLHGDFTYQNVFVDAHGEVTHVYDLEKACLGPRTYELGRSLVINCFDDGWGERQVTLARTFLRAYQEILPITYEEFSLGMKMYFMDLIHMTWIEAKYVIYQEEQQLPLYERHANRVRRVHAGGLEDIPDNIYFGQ